MHNIHSALFISILSTITCIAISYTIISINEKLICENSRLRTIIDASPNVILILDPEGKILDCNRRFSQVLGMPKESLIGKTNRDFYSKEKIAEINENISVVREYKKAMTHETCYEGVNKLMFCVEEHIIPLLDKKDTIIGFIIVTYNINKQKEIQEVLRKAKEKSEIINEKQKKILDYANDKIRTQLNDIIKIINLLKKTKATKIQEEIIHLAEGEYKNLLKTIDDINDLSQIEI